jgi:hypothetical protein
MDRQALVDSIAYCGLVCGRCHLRKECDGCKNTARLCARSKVCYQRNCCIQKGLQGCWECDEFPCGKDMHGPVHDLRIRAFVAFIKTEGTETLVDCLLRMKGGELIMDKTKITTARPAKRKSYGY